MIHSYEEALEFFNDRAVKLGMDFGLERMELVLGRLGNPEKKIPMVHIAGSNGKGSTLAFLKEILMAQGYKVASFTSPYLENPNEQIQIGHEMITDEELVDLVNELIPVLTEIESDRNFLTSFEVYTVLAFMYFEKKRPSIALIETGLGGRLDSTNVIHPLLAIITSISLEHTQLLGDTLAEIAAEKAGIIKEGISVITAVESLEALQPIMDKAAQSHAELFHMGKDFWVENRVLETSWEFFDFQSKAFRYSGLRINMLGRHQLSNASLAIQACTLLERKYGFMVKEESIRSGLANAKWKGRFEQISTDPVIILDGAHNVSGIKALLQTIEERFGDKNVHFIFAALKDKDYPQMIRAIEKKAASITFTQTAMDRMNEARELYKMSEHEQKYIEVNWQEAIKRTCGRITGEDVLIITGSLYFLAEARPFIINSR
ncbi:bifunctional folylpolyglutamate synthase/dihydrofolate synthase [Pradoshia eiseniae]|uniref:tetrahydrofolate synthase n=1 Tax=Pradoshia eiseniae TaxID=2064768 RepID=A0A2S7N2W0_9BACI|nr:bifunctional folylpolyglutamate synthase/dihydrofolate synthase [Pradoshia eiseniae]